MEKKMEYLRKCSNEDLATYFCDLLNSDTEKVEEMNQYIREIVRRFIKKHSLQHKESDSLKLRYKRGYELQHGTLKMVLELEDFEGLKGQKLQNILGDIALNSRNFYMSVGREINNKLS